MAQVTFIAPVDTIRGKLHSRDKTILRRKRIRDTNGRVITELAQESYVIHNPRDWKRNPPTGAEKANMDNWKQACLRAKAELADDALRTQWLKRWEAQLQRGEDEAPVDPTTKRHKIYVRFDCFVRAVLFRELRIASI